MRPKKKLTYDDTWRKQRTWVCKKGINKKGPRTCSLYANDEDEKLNEKELCNYNDNRPSTHQRRCVINAMIQDLQNALNVAKVDENSLPGFGYKWMRTQFGDAYNKYSRDSRTQNQHFQVTLQRMIEDLYKEAKRKLPLEDWYDTNTVAACLQKPYDAYAFAMFKVPDVSQWSSPYVRQKVE